MLRALAISCGGLACALVLSAAPASAEPPAEASVARAEIDNTLSAMLRRAQSVRELLRDARRRGASDAAACFDEALSRCDAAVRHGRQLADDAKAAYARGDVDAAREARRHLADEELLQIVARRDANACR